MIGVMFDEAVSSLGESRPYMVVASSSEERLDGSGELLLLFVPGLIGWHEEGVLLVHILELAVEAVAVLAELERFPATAEEREEGKKKKIRQLSKSGTATKGEMDEFFPCRGPRIILSSGDQVLLTRLISSFPSWIQCFSKLRSRKERFVCCQGSELFQTTGLELHRRLLQIGV